MTAGLELSRTACAEAIVLREATRRLGIILVFDEVVSVRVAYGGAEEHFGVEPDLCCLGKLIGGGLPLGAFGGREDIMALFDPSRGPPAIPHPGSYNANPVSLAAGLATGNSDLLGDMICCPGLDYCNLANARSIPIAKEIAKRFEDLKRQQEIGPLRLNMSGCINACGHHHSGNIGILGVDKKGTELYQISLGGSPKDDAAVGTIIGPGFRAEAVPDAIDTIISTYLANRTDGEDFVATWRRIGAKTGSTT